MRFRTWQNIAPVDVSGLRAAQTANQNNLFEDGANLFKTFNQAVAGSDYRAAQNNTPQNKQDILALQRLADESGNASYIKNTANQLDQFNTNQGIKYKFDRKSLDKKALEQQGAVQYITAKLGAADANSPEGRNLLLQLKAAQNGLLAISNERQQADNSFLGIGNNQVSSVQPLPNTRPIQPIPGSNPAAVQPPVQTANTSSNAVQQIQNTSSTLPPAQTPVNQINNANAASPTQLELEKSQLAQIDAQLKTAGSDRRGRRSSAYKNLVQQKKDLVQSIQDRRVADGKQPINNLVTQNIAPTSAPTTIKANTSNPPTKAITTFRKYSKIVPKAQGDALLDKINTTVNQFGQDAPETNQGLVEGYKSILTSFTEQKASLTATKLPNSSNNKFIKRDNAKIDNQIKQLTAKENEIKSNIDSLNQVISNQKTANTNLEKTTKNFNSIIVNSTDRDLAEPLGFFNNLVSTPDAPLNSVSEQVALNNGYPKTESSEVYDEIKAGLQKNRTDYLNTTGFSSIRDVLVNKMGLTDITQGTSQVVDLLERAALTMWARKVRIDKEYELDSSNISKASLGNAAQLKNVIDGLFKNKKGKDFKKALSSYKGSNYHKLLFSLFPEVPTFVNSNSKIN